MGISVRNRELDTHQLPPPSQPTIDAAHVDVEQIVQDFAATIPTLEDALVEYRHRTSRQVRQATFVRGGAVMRFGDTQCQADDCLYLVNSLFSSCMFELDREFQTTIDI